MKNITDNVEEKKYGIDWEKLNKIKRENNIIQRWCMGLTPEDLVNFRTLNDDRVYNSKFEYWNERRKDLVDTFKTTSELLYPPIINKITHSTLMAVSFPFSLAVLGNFYFQIIPRCKDSQKFVREDKGYVFK